ncbi:MAG: outer membrane protein assembly factor BamA [Candidatus Lernaella stagnicola]|nr:outer membrane protein assembly factor BamA [Candidatus Lernaella stagnicola]
MKVRFALILVLFVCGLASAAVAQTTTEIITDIRIEGSKRIEDDAILAALETRPGDLLDSMTIDADLRAIFELGFFADVRIELEDAPRGKTMVIVVEEKPAVKEFVFEGNDKVKDDKIEEIVDLKPNTILSIAKIKENIERVRQLYEAEGFFMVDIGYEIEPLPNNRVKVVIRITEYRKIFLKRIDFVGNNAFTDEELRKVLQTKQGHVFSFMGNSGVYRETMFAQDLQLLRMYYANAGYFVQIGQPVVSLSADRRWMYVSVAINEGPQYYVESVDIEGELLFKKEDLMELISVEVGEVFNRGEFDKSLDKLKNRYTDVGYAFADIEPGVEPDPQTRRVRIKFTVNKGKLAYIERIEILGNDRTRDKVLRRELFIKEGDLFSGPGIRASKALLMRRGYFDEVSVKWKRGSREDLVVVVIEVAEKMQGQFIIGVGFSSLENFVGTAQISHNNLFGYGWKFSLQGELGQYRTNGTIRFREPYLLDTRWIFGLSLNYTDRDYFSFQRLDKAAIVSLGRPLYLDIQAHLAYTYQDVDIRNVASNASLFLTLQEGRKTTTSARGTLQRDTVNHPFDPTDGSRLSFSTEWASESFGGDLNFLKYTAMGRRYVPVVWGIAIMVNGEAGYADNLDSGRLPVTERYFLGGLNSVRGFFSRSLGPRETSVIPRNLANPATTTAEVESVIGGNKYLQGNIELLIPIIKQIGIKGVLFYDVGNAFVEEDWYDFRDLRQSWGFGVRWISPIGPLRFEWGFPLYKRDDEENQVFEFGIGTFF